MSNAAYVSRGTCCVSPNATNRTGSVVTYSKPNLYNSPSCKPPIAYNKTCQVEKPQCGPKHRYWSTAVHDIPQNANEVMQKPTAFGWSWCFWLALIVGIIVIAFLIGWFIKAVSKGNHHQNIVCGY